VPAEYSRLYSFPNNTKLETFNGMVSVVDQAVGNLTRALKARPGTWAKTLLIYTHDNGAPLGGGGSNFPFRGGSATHYGLGVCTHDGGAPLCREWAVLPDPR
jgi:arylsulfatase B